MENRQESDLERIWENCTVSSYYKTEWSTNAPAYWRLFTLTFTSQWHFEWLHIIHNSPSLVLHWIGSEVGRRTRQIWTYMYTYFFKWGKLSTLFAKRNIIWKKCVQCTLFFIYWCWLLWLEELWSKQHPRKLPTLHLPSSHVSQRDGTGNRRKIDEGCQKKCCFITSQVTIGWQRISQVGSIKWQWWFVGRKEAR